MLIANNSLLSLPLYGEVHLGMAATHTFNATDFHFLEGLEYFREMNLDIGYYKIKNRSRRASNEFHYLRVFVKDNKKWVQIDDEEPVDATDEMTILLESYTIIKKITHHNPVEVNNAVMTVSWNDEDEDPFEMRMRNIQTFKNALNLFPRVAKALKLK